MTSDIQVQCFFLARDKDDVSKLESPTSLDHVNVLISVRSFHVLTFRFFLELFKDAKLSELGFNS